MSGGSNEVLIRIIAGVLAIIGAFWGFLLFAIFNSEGNPNRVAFFVLTAGPGYLVTAGYFLRTVFYLKYELRVALWIASILVHGFWLSIGLLDARPSEAMLWWISAEVASIIALWMEPKK